MKMKMKMKIKTKQNKTNKNKNKNKNKEKEKKMIRFIVIKKIFSVISFNTTIFLLLMPIIIKSFVINLINRLIRVFFGFTVYWPILNLQKMQCRSKEKRRGRERGGGKQNKSITFGEKDYLW